MSIKMKKFLLLICSVFLIGSVVSCGEAIPDEGAVESTSASLIPIETVFEIVAAENDVARGLYTSKVVGPGLQVGIGFDEAWQEASVEAGPLPALFLRGASESVSKSPVPLFLFLGSDFPIEPANKFTDVQQEKFDLIRADGKPQYFFDEELEVYTAMFEDVAVAQPCVVCHNEHPETPKDDWEMDEIMGATTWTYPKEAVTIDEFYDILNVFRQGVRDSYDSFITESDGWAEQPAVGELWPSESDFAIPSTDVFMERFEELASPATLAAVMDATSDGN